MYERYQLDVVLREQTGEAVRRSALYLQTNNKLDFAAFDGIKLTCGLISTTRALKGSLRIDYSCTLGTCCKLSREIRTNRSGHSGSSTAPSVPSF